MSTPHNQERALTLSFSQPAGREQIKTSKKAAKALGKKKLSLEELSEGAKVEVQYYPALGQVMELVVDSNRHFGIATRNDADNSRKLLQALHDLMVIGTDHENIDVANRLLAATIATGKLELFNRRAGLQM